MSDSTPPPEGFSLKRWSRRKLEAARVEATEPAPAAPLAATTATAPATAPAAAVASATPDPAPPTAAESEAPLPPIESLTENSDFSAFMQPKVDEVLKRAALKKLFTDPHFNVMDGLDIYVGDYTQSDPMPEGMLEKLGKVYGKVKEAVADADAAPDLASTVRADANALEVAPAPVTVADENAPAPALSAPGALPTLPNPEAQTTLPLPLPESPAITVAPAVPEATR